MEKELQAIYFKHDLAIQSLVTSAISQIIIKILFFNNKLMTIQEIQKNVKRNVKVNIGPDKLLDATSELISNSIINKYDEKYRLRDKYYLKLKKIHEERTQKYNRVINKYFKKSQASKTNISGWFNEINIKFFLEYSYEWVNNLIGKISKSNNYIDNLKVINNPKIYRKFQIPSKERKWFAEQYIKFLRSYDPEDNSIMWDYANSMFSAKIISANIFTDISIKEMFKDSIVILDTNILLYLDFEKDTYSLAYDVLGKIFKELNIKPVYFHITKDEYKSAINHVIDEMKNVIFEYDYDVYSKTKGIFMESAIHRQCNEDKHFDEFFKDISEIPEYFDTDHKIVEFDDREIDRVIIKGMKNKKLKSEMNDIYKKTHDYNKISKSLEHDAGLISGAKCIRKKENAWILTRDHTVHTYSTDNTKEGDIPIAMSLDTIINLFAVNDGGIELDPCDFVPLLANTIRNHLIPETGTFQIEDLSRMHELESQITELSKDEIISIAKDINHARLEGSSEKKLALLLQRRFQNIKIGIKDELSETKVKLHQKEKDFGRISIENINLKNSYFKKRREELKQEYKTKKTKDIKNSSILIFIIIALLLFGYFYLKDTSALTPLLSVFIGLISSIIVTILFSKYLFQPLFSKEFNNKLSNIESVIDKEYNDMLKENNIPVDIES